MSLEHGQEYEVVLTNGISVCTNPHDVPHVRNYEWCDPGTRGTVIGDITHRIPYTFFPADRDARALLKRSEFRVITALELRAEAADADRT